MSRNDSNIWYGRAMFDVIDNMHKYYKDEYIPSFQDLVQSRPRAIGVNKIKFAVKRGHETDHEEIYGIFDVKGTKTERGKWMHFMDSTDFVLFTLIWMVEIVYYGLIIDIIG